MVLFPISDDNPTRNPPVVTIALIVACIVVFVLQLTQSDYEAQRFVYAFGAVPVLVTGRMPPEAGPDVIPPWATMVTCMFLHGGFMHLAGNMLFLWIFGNNVEDAMGRVRFVIFYVICGLAAAGLHIAEHPESEVPMVGASGAISGILGAYFMLHPHAHVRALLTLVIITTVSLPAWVFLGFWFLSQWLGRLGAGDDGIAWSAHLGGFIAGVVLIPLFKGRDVRLFAPPQTTRWGERTRWPRGD